MMVKRQGDIQAKLADALFPLEIAAETEEAILSIPPEKRVLRTEQYDFSVSTIVSMMAKKDITIPEYQRHYVWSERQASRLIESLIIQCPVPVIYLNQEKDETFAVIDGNQRLNSIRAFLENRFRLTGLTSYPELTGYTFDELDTRFQRHISNRVLRCTVILKETHPQVKFDVFERLNSGAVSLTRQELRHGLFHGSLLQRATKIAKIINLDGYLGRRKDKRMKVEELVLRFWALHKNIDHYEKPLATFISSFADDNRDLPSGELDTLEDSILQAYERAEKLFGNLAFTYSANGKDYRFNAAVLDAQLIACSSLSDARYSELSLKVTKVRNAYKQLSEDPAFIKSVTIATSDKTAIQGRVARLQKVLKDIQ